MVVKENPDRKKNYYLNWLITVADWDSMNRVITQTHGRAFETHGRAFQTLGLASSFLLNPQKLGRVF